MKTTTSFTACLGTLPVLLCQCGATSHPPPPDYTPFGDGLTAIGICLVCFAVVQVLGSLVGGGKP